MKFRTWQVWAVYVACLAIALPALAWLTLSALRLERAQRDAQRAAELEKQLRLASWRIDTKLMPLVAQESARPYADYQPLIAQGFGFRGGSTRALSLPSEYVLGYFQASEQGSSVSPLARRDATEAAALTDGLRRSIDPQKLLAQLPEEYLPSASVFADADDVTAMARNYANAKMKNPSKEFEQRQEAVQSNTAREIAQQRASPIFEQPPNIREGVMQAVWLGDHLVLARRVALGSSQFAQGVWLDWPRLHQELAMSVADLVPDVQLLPLADPDNADEAHVLATLPVQLVVPATTDATALSPLRMSLHLAWAGLLIGALALGLLVAGVVALSRRREAFVSAVTHELRTPLTTFRMYSEMLDGGMVSDADRPGYVRTLRVEAERLWHLVENVLAYARLERGRGTQRQAVTLAELWSRMETRLHDRAAGSGMKLNLQHAAGDAVLVTDPAAVEQIVFNLIDNACKYAAGSAVQAIDIQLSAEEKRVTIRVQDRGPGIARDAARQLFQPFSKSAAQAATSAPGVGLGLSLSRQLARQLGGDLRHEATSGGGATFVLTLARV